jgi:UDP-N-acetylglucosamine diphosphorylase/glucosamine-1-phosphate N-acetyltransferase
VAEIRIGILTMAERWELLLTGQASTVAQDFLSEQYPLALARDNYFINASLLPTHELVREILQLDQGEALTKGDELLAARLDDKSILRISDPDGEGDEIPGYTYEGDATLLHRPYDLFIHNARMIAFDMQLICGSRHSQQLSKSNTVIGNGQVFLERGASIEACIFNTNDGPIYIGENAQVMEGSMLRGPLAICESATVKMGAKVYGGTTVGPHCKVGGEISNVVFQAYSNKGHDGYLGNAVIGQWCNIGADTNASNLKNNYGSVKVWDYDHERFADSGQQFCGLIMGDHAKCGINTMFNTGTVVGVAANVFGSGFPRAFVPDFAWGGASSMTTHKLPKVYETADLMMGRRGLSLSELEKDAIEHVFALTKDARRWE